MKTTRSNRTETVAEVLAKLKPPPPPEREYLCDACQDTGEIYGPHTDWQVQYCDCAKGQGRAQENAEFQARVQQELAQARQQTLDARFQNAGLPERHKTLTVDDLADGRARGKGPAIRAVKAFREGEQVQVRDGEKNSLVLFGPVGTGKTAMLTEVARCWLEAGKVVLFVQYNRFIAAIQETYGGDGSWQELVEAAVNCDLLVLDDVGDPDGNGRAESPDRREKVFLVVNERYNLGRPVVLATNLLGKEEFRQVFGERIADRLGEMAAWFNVGGVNLRKSP